MSRDIFTHTTCCSSPPPGSWPCNQEKWIQSDFWSPRRLFQSQYYAKVWQSISLLRLKVVSSLVVVTPVKSKVNSIISNTQGHRTYITIHKRRKWAQGRNTGQKPEWNPSGSSKSFSSVSGVTGLRLLFLWAFLTTTLFSCWSHQARVRPQPQILSQIWSKLSNTQDSGPWPGPHLGCPENGHELW